MRPFVALLILFAFRQVCQALCALPEPKDMIWRYPGFPSLLSWLAITAGVVAFLEATTVIVLRAHYTMDVLAAACAAGCAAITAGWLCTFF